MDTCTEFSCPTHGPDNRRKCSGCHVLGAVCKRTGLAGVGRCCESCDHWPEGGR